MTRPARLLALAGLLALGLPAIVPAQDTGANPPSPKPSIYDAKADARDQVEAAGRQARRDNQRLLIMFGGDWCGWCHKLHDLFASDPAIRKVLSEDYRVVMVDTKAPHADALLDECKGNYPSVGYPFLAVLDPYGKVLTRQKTDPLEVGDHHDPEKVLAFLEEWAPPVAAAKDVEKAALARASSEDKRILLHFGAPWCGWCHRLEDFLNRDDIAPRIAKDFLDVKVDTDRMVGGNEMLNKYRKAEGGGIPWMVILDAKGQPLISSDGPHGNVGYPATADEIAHFMAMMKKSARNMDEADLAAIEAALKDAGAKIEETTRIRVRNAAAVRPEKQ